MPPPSLPPHFPSVAVEGNGATATLSDQERAKPTDGWLREVVGQAASLADRLSGRYEFPNPECASELRQGRLDTWCKNTTRGDLARFDSYLRWYRLDRSAALQLLGPTRLREGECLPSWAALLAEIIEASSDDTESAEHRAFQAETPVPFEDIYRPILVVAARRLRSAAGTNCARLADSAHLALERGLLLQLDQLGRATLYLEFNLLRHQRLGGVDFLPLSTESTPSRELYHEFAESLRSAGLRAFFAEYATLARQLSLAALFWIESTAEFINRLEADLPEISRAFGNRLSQERVTHLDVWLSDPHREARTVSILTLTDGSRLVYKPRTVELEATFARLIEWMNATPAPVDLKPLRVLERDTHGWIEFVKSRPQAGADEAQRFHRRAGALLCLAYVLEGTDLHYENIVVQGDHPVLVDLETLFHPYWDASDLAPGSAAQTLAHQALRDSVIRSGLLPSWQRGRDNAAFDISGLGSDRARIDRQLYRPVHFANTDAMRLDVERSAPPAIEASAAPTLSSDEEQTLVDGFEATYRFLQIHATTLLAPGSPLQAFAGRRARFVPRNTSIYARMLRHSHRPQFLRHGIDYSLNLERLSRAMLPPTPTLPTEPPSLWPLWLAESESLERADVPYFLSETDSPNIHLSAHARAALNPGLPAFAKVVARLRRLGDDDLARQRALIRTTFHLRRTETGRTPGGEPALDLPPAAYHGPQLLAAATAIARKIAAQAVRADDGSMTWIAPQLLVEADRYQLINLDLRLYDGSPGLALFFSALHHITGETEFRDWALGTLVHLRTAIRTPGHAHAIQSRFGIGGATGVGGMLYALVTAGRLLGCRELIDEAIALSAVITPEAIARDGDFDVMGGSAGTILGLLALYEAAQEPCTLDQARRCAAHLLVSRTPRPCGKRAWTPRRGAQDIGFAHGVAGIVYALLRLHRLAPDPALLAAATEAVSFEQETCKAPALNSAPLRRTSHRMNSWCNGPVGIGLARLGTLEVWDNDACRAEIARAVTDCVVLGVRQLDMLCCGNAGRIELLLTASRRLEEPSLLAAARLQAAQIVERARLNGGYSLHPAIPGEWGAPGLFTGVSGIGYMLLRAAYPEQLPAPLLWQ